MGRSSGIKVLVCRDCQGIGQVDCPVAIYCQDVGERDITGLEGMSFKLLACLADES